VRITLALLVVALGGAAAAQAPVRDQKPFKAGVEIVTIAATVTDAEGHLIRDLPQEAFEAFEDGEKQTITQFTNERVPLGLGLLLDASDSMFGTRIRDARAAVDKFLFDLLDPADEFFVSTFNHKPRSLTTWGRDRTLVQRVLAAVQPSGGTAIYDAVLGALPMMATRTRQRAAILVISDGAGTASDGTLRDVRVIKPSGHPQLDRNVVAAIRRAAPFGPLPSVFGNELAMTAQFDAENPAVR